MLKEILERIDKRLSALNLKESRAAVMSGLSSSAIRNWRRAIKANKEPGVSTKTIAALAPTLNTTAAWLLEGSGPEELVERPIDKTSNEAIVARTHEARSRANIALADMAKALGVTEVQYKKFETSTPIAPNLVAQFCKITLISADWLFSGESDDSYEASSTSRREAL
ncbi:hypothetical protein [Brucella pseudogrignonensis]|uniref:hypothetical protein n=1 Tax=Brucella pseudogrignonensis TaxID=419475 RepID=UPI000CFC4E71|nr:hypothetical protein [Brucella pseudogrignonensis]MQP38626.1 hypothetical protein [Ochrobactrum sp. MYb237]